MTERSQPIDKDAVERDPVADLAEHLCARRPCGDTPENVADWLAYSLDRCGLLLVTEQRLTDLTLAHPTEQTDDAVVEAVEVIEALVECHIKRGPWDEPLGSSEQAPSINAANAFLAKLESRQ